MEPVSSVEQQFLKKLIDIIDANLHNEQFGVNELATELGMSRITLHRKVKSVVKKSVSEFIRETRLKRGYELLQQKTGTVSEIAYKVGFGSAAYFTKCFHDYFGYPPGEVLKGMHRDVEKAPGKNKQSLIQKLQKSKILYIIPIVILLTVVVVQFIRNSDNQMEKSIAVLPFIDESPEQGNEYIINGLRQEIMNDLVLIDGIRLVSRQTSEQYLGSTKSITIIGKELKANYILEGNAQTSNNKTRIRLKLIETKTNKHLWAKPYEREITMDNLFEIQKEIAEMVASELETVISPTVKEKITLPCANKTAYSFYLRAWDYYNIYINENDYDALLESKNLFKLAIKNDSTFTHAYIRLGWVLIAELKFTPSKIIGDSVLWLVNKAIEINPEFSEAYSFKGFLIQGNQDEAIKAFNLAIKYDPKNWQGYHQLSNFYCNTGEYCKSIENGLKSLEVNSEPIVHDWTLINLNVDFSFTGYFDEATKFREEYFAEYNNNKLYLNMRQCEEIMKEDFENSIKYGLQAYQLDSTDLTTLDYLGQCFLYLNNAEEAYHYYQKYIESIKHQPYYKLESTDYELAYFYNSRENGIGHAIFPILHTAYTLSLNGDKKLFNIYTEAITDNVQKHIEFNSMLAQTYFSYLELGCVYALLNEKQIAIENLRMLKKRKINPIWLLIYLNHSPLLETIREEPEFKKIVSDVEEKYQAEHEQVKKLLISKGWEEL